MRATTVFLIFSAGALGALAYIGHDTGVKIPELPDISLPKTLNPFPGQSTEGGEITVYKWQDATGQWHYSNEPPADNRPFERIGIDTRANVLPGNMPDNDETPEQTPSSSPAMTEALRKFIEPNNSAP